MNVNVYEGRFGYEKLLFHKGAIEDWCQGAIPQKNDFVFYNETAYKVLYRMIDFHNDEYAIFVRKAIEEDY